jgi:hypothetical protein
MRIQSIRSAKFIVVWIFVSKSRTLLQYSFSGFMVRKFADESLLVPLMGKCRDFFPDSCISHHSRPLCTNH